MIQILDKSRNTEVSLLFSSRFYDHLKYKYILVMKCLKMAQKAWSSRKESKEEQSVLSSRILFILIHIDQVRDWFILINPTLIGSMNFRKGELFSGCFTNANNVVLTDFDQTDQFHR